MRADQIPFENPFTHNAEAWLAAIVESSDDAVVGKTLDSIIRSWNGAATRIFGYTPDEIIGRSVLTLIPPELHHEEDQILARLVRGERIEHYETTRMHKDGKRIDVSLSVSPILDASGTVIGAAKIARDITEAKRMQRAEREYTEQLQNLATELEQQIEEAQALQEEIEQTNDDLARALADAEESRRHAEAANAAKSAFLATMSHELRTPLNAIAGYLDILLMEIRGPLTESQREDLVRIKRSEETLLRLIEDVLNFAKLESGRLDYDFEEVRIDEFLRLLEAFIAPRLAQKGLSYELNSCGADVAISIDRNKVEQILLNLLSNAVKFTDSGRITVACEVEQSRLLVHVEDTGRGIPPAMLDSIFEPFVQGDRSLTRTAEGTGLGLSISRHLARGMGGDITVESRPGAGSVFTLVLPRR
jgi:PAS domain S-box-containing protein